MLLWQVTNSQPMLPSEYIDNNVKTIDLPWSINVLIEIIGDRKVWYHDPVAGSDLHMTHTSSNNLTFCKVYGPFSKVNENGLHFTTPEDSDNHDLLR